MFYVYEYYIIATNEVFYVGKGTGNRYKELRNRSAYFMRVYNKYKCNVRFVKEGLTNEESCKLEIDRITELKAQGFAKCNFTYGGTGFSTGDLNPKRLKPPKGALNPMHGVKLCGKDNHFYGRKHSEETKKRISESRKGKGGQFGKDNPMYGVRRYGKDNPMYGVSGIKHHNSKTYEVLYTDSSTEVLCYSECVKKFGIAFIRVSNTGGILQYKKKTPNSIYEGVIVKLLEPVTTIESTSADGSE